MPSRSRTLRRVLVLVLVVALAAACARLGGDGLTPPSSSALDSSNITDEPGSAIGDLKPFVGEWARHSTSFSIQGDGTGRVHERTYRPCGTSMDCMFNATLVVQANTDKSATITYMKVWFNDPATPGQPILRTPEEHKVLDPYFPLPNDQMEAVIDQYGHLVLSPIGPAARRLKRDVTANTYCGNATDQSRRTDCGA
jgi:hypothetical protein